ncbi:SEC14-like protein 2 [Folsomia candida]|uniref:SEC14-like protein 2 n=1 Tax=Folsomia candida TaxID=158441 RepID=UPI000B9066D3|nr:SEC14-like protein 2 [Folsomia candida]
MNFVVRYFSFVIILQVTQVINLVASVDSDVTITLEQKQIMDKFRDVVSPRLPHDYMNQDIYLIRWLRAKKFDIKAAEAMLMENLQWRKDNDIDNILTEDWSDFEAAFPYEIHGCDKEGRPVISMSTGEWNVRGILLSGKLERAVRYYDKMFEETSTLIRQAQKDGDNMTQFNLIMDFSNWNLVVHACPLCVSLYIRFYQSLETHYPGSMHTVWCINVPQLFNALWQISKEFLSSDTQALIKIYGRGRDEWKQALLKRIDPDNLTVQYGGLNEEGLTMDEVKFLSGSDHSIKCSRMPSLREKKRKLKEVSNSE